MPNETEIVEMLLDPDAYPWPIDDVSHLQTHISHLFFAGNRVVKIKRPVEYGFANLTTLESRELACHDEVRLNRRLTDDIYIDALPIIRSESGVIVGGHGTPIEWATVMRRFPIDATLDHILAADSAPHDLAAQLAERLIPFHTSALLCAGTPEEQAAGAERILRQNLDEIAALRPGLVFPYEFELIRNRITLMLDLHPGEILERARGGMIREGHGDLKCEHVLLDPPGSLQIFDCVEFSLAIRCADIASDLAFLMLDLERLGAAHVATELVERYRAAGIDLPDDQLSLYTLHRGLVKVKTSALTTPSASSKPELDVASWLHLVFRTGYEVAPVIIAMTGFSGSGKSVVARQIAAVSGAPIYSTDSFRRESAAPHPERYSPASRLAIYERMIERAATQLETGRPIVLDGAFLRVEERTLAALLAGRFGVPLIFVEVTADSAVVERRITARTAGDAPAFDSEATSAVLAAQRQNDPAPFPEGTLRLEIDNSAEAPVSLDSLLKMLMKVDLLSLRSP